MRGRWGHTPTAVARTTPVVGAAVLLTLGGGAWTAVTLTPPQSGTSVLRDAQSATVRPADRAAHPATDGDRLRAGDLVRTGPSGRAELDSAGSRLLIGPASVVQVLGAASFELRQGTAGLLHAADAMPASVVAGPLSIGVTRSGSAVHIERGYLVRAAVLAGEATLTTPDGGLLALRDLDEADLPGVTLPATPSPVQRLDHDAASIDAVLAPDLVASDIALSRLANQVDADARAVVAFTPAAASRRLSAPSEVALPQAIAAASRIGPVAARVEQATALRAAGAAWGVIAAKLQVSTQAVRAVIATLLGATGQQGNRSDTAPISTRLAGGAGPLVTLAPIAQPSRTTPAHSPTPTQPTPTRRASGPTPSASAPPPASVPPPSPAKPSPAPSPSPSLGLVNGLLETVGSLLAPAPAASISPGAPSAAHRGLLCLGNCTG